ncbi:MAG: hypothetical protein ABIU05_16735 [Nitrospirales bacterium]
MIVGRHKNERSPQAVCFEYGSEFVPADADSSVGIALASLGKAPLNALHHPLLGNTCGWYIWGGEVLSQDPEFFQPLHVHHLTEYYPSILSYLGLAPGWRGLIAPGQVEVWHDPELLEVFDAQGKKNVSGVFS